MGEDDELRARIEARINARRAQMDTSRDKGKAKPADEGEPAAPAPAGEHTNRLAPRRPWLTGTAPSVREANERAASGDLPDAPVGSAAALEPSRPWLDQERDSQVGSPRPEVRKPPASLAVPEESMIDEPLSRRERRQQRRADRQAEKFREQQEREAAKAQAQQDRDTAKVQAQQQRDDERARRDAERANRRTGAPTAPVAQQPRPQQPVSAPPAAPPAAPEPPTVPPPVVTPSVPRPEQVRVPVPDVVQSAPQPPAPAVPERVEPEPAQPEPVEPESVVAHDPEASEPAPTEQEPAPAAAVAPSAPQPPVAPLPVSEYQSELEALRAQIAELAAELNAAPVLAPRGSAEPDEADGSGGLFRRGRRPDGQ